MKRNELTPHYRIIAAAGYFDDLESLMGMDATPFRRDLGRLAAPSGDVVTRYADNQFIEALISINARRVASAAIGFTAPLRYLESNGRCFEIDPELNALLEQTDIGNQAPGSAFQLPFPSMYFHFEKSTIPILSSDRTDTRLAGIYLFELDCPTMELDSRIAMGAPGPARCFEIVFVSQGRPGKPEDSDFIHTRFVIPDAWEDDPIIEILNRQMDQYEKNGQRGDDHAYEIFKKNMAELEGHLMKCLLFLNSDEAITEEINELKKLTEKEKATLNKAKKRKIKQQLTRAFDKIYVRHRPDVSDSGITDAKTGHLLDRDGRRAHWRRGHFRQQAYGEGYQLRKTRWIRPALVSGSKPEKEKIYHIS